MIPEDEPLNHGAAELLQLLDADEEEMACHYLDVVPLTYYRDRLLAELRRYTPDEFLRIANEITGVRTERFVTPAIRELWFGGYVYSDDPVNLARALRGLVLRLRDDALEPSAVLELESLCAHLEKAFFDAEIRMWEEVSNNVTQ